MWWCRFESKFWLPLVRCQPIRHTIKHSNNLCRNLFRTGSLFRTWICKHSGFRNFHSAKCCGESNFIQLDFFNTIIYLDENLQFAHDRIFVQSTAENRCSKLGMLNFHFDNGVRNWTFFITQLGCLNDYYYKVNPIDQWGNSWLP